MKGIVFSVPICVSPEALQKPLVGFVLALITFGYFFSRFHRLVITTFQFFLFSAP